MKRLLRNKKGQGIPTMSPFQTIMDGIRSFISWFFTTAPKPLLILFFLLFILLLGNVVLPLIGNGMGFHCDTNGAVWKVSGLNIFSNFDLIRNKPEIDQGQFEKIPFICGGSGIDSNHVIACTNCTANKSLGFLNGCLNDGYRLDDYKFFKAIECTWLGCAPSEGYFYNISVDKFHCKETWCINKTLDDYNQQLYEVEGATPIFIEQERTNFTAEKMLGFRCAENDPLSIRFTFFGVDIFNYRIWVALLVIGALMYFYKLVN